MHRQTYTAPKLVSHGKLENITHATSPLLTRLDGSYSVGASGLIFT